MGDIIYGRALRSKCISLMRKCANSVESVLILQIFRLPLKVKSVVLMWVKRLRFRTRLVRCIEFSNIICKFLDGLNIYALRPITTNMLIRIGQIIFTTSILLRRKSAWLLCYVIPVYKSLVTLRNIRILLLFPQLLL